MHLLLIHQNFPGQFRDLGEAWLQMGHQITAIGSAEEPSDGKRWCGLTYIRYKIKSENSPTFFDRGQAVATACRQLQKAGSPPDLVLVHSGWGEAHFLREVFPSTPVIVFPELWGNPLALGYGFDQHLDGRTADPDWFLEQNRLCAEAINNSDLAIAPCKAQAQSFPAHLRDQLTVLPEGLDLGLYGPDPSAAISLNGHCFAAGEPLVTVVSRSLEPLRGIRQALLAWPAIAKAMPEAQLLLVGHQNQGYGVEQPTGDLSHLETCLNELPAEIDHARIHLLGCLDHSSMVRLLQCSACHLALSYPYTLSWSTLEAIACEAPLISNPGAPVVNELIEGESVVLVPFNDHQALASATTELLQKPLKRRRLGRTAGRIVAERFSLATSLTTYEQLFNQLTSKLKSS
jgi:glycosyltransferase involved in cell wall biosynthesis